MTLTLDEQEDNLIVAIAAEINRVTGIRGVLLDDDFPTTLEYPCAHIQLEGCRNITPTAQDPQDWSDWILFFNITCMGSLLSKDRSFTDARKFTNRVYNMLRAQLDTGYLFDGNCLTMSFSDVTYGYIDLGTFMGSFDRVNTGVESLAGVIVKGGQFTIEIQIIEER